MKKDEYKVQEILKKMKEYNNSNIVIVSKNKNFEINFTENLIPHLIGIHYMNKSTEKIKGKKLLKRIFKENLSDKDILNKIEVLHGEVQKRNVENRINSFENFMENLEKGIVVEKTLESKMKVNYLIIQNEKNEYFHLGILSGDNGALLENYEELTKEEKDIFKTYFVENNNDYFNKSKLYEPLKEILKYNDDLDEYIPFSFNKNKNEYLIEKWKENKEINYREEIEKYNKKLEEIDKEKTIDSDGDGLLDIEEKNIYFTDEISKDTDKDGITDGEEVKIKKSHPKIREKEEKEI